MSANHGRLLTATYEDWEAFTTEERATFDRRNVAVLEMSGWVHNLADWKVISHLTFAWEARLDSAQRCYEKFMARHLPDVSYFYALERNPARDGYHVHALWADTIGVYRRSAWQKWFERFGRARIEPVRDRNDVSDYCSKYVSKERSWWNVKLVEPTFAKLS